MTATATKERPILFSGPMVRAILEGRKTQTRRIIKIPSWGQGDIELCDKAGMGQSAIDWPNVVCKATGCLAEIPCPYGWRGDRLWVRECWRFGYPVKLKGPSMNIESLQYRADYSDSTPVPWRPSIHMKRKDSRITLEIVRVRAERLQDITEEDAIAEGNEVYNDKTTAKFCIPGPTYRFEHLWKSINGDDSWAANPWVWVIEFKRVTA